MRYGNLEARVAKLEPPPPWIDRDVDNFLAATGGRPGEKVYEILERRAVFIWADWTEDGEELGHTGLNRVGR
jgi:hypothetical protein